MRRKRCFFVNRHAGPDAAPGGAAARDLLRRAGQVAERAPRACCTSCAAATGHQARHRSCEADRAAAEQFEQRRPAGPGRGLAGACAGSAAARARWGGGRLGYLPALPAGAGLVGPQGCGDAGQRPGMAAPHPAA
eukprot:scaffold19909_cov130-Isochrysis_galbana.AAC.8